jgi:hypothetical protein
VQGRFTGVDPMNFGVAVINPQNWNRYIYALNNPISVMDKNGKWPSPIHDLIVDMAFPGLSLAERENIKRGSLSVDQVLKVPITLLPQNANQHAMSRSGQTQAKAIASAADFVADNVAMAQSYADIGSSVHPNAHYFFGRSAHTLMDGTSPAHMPYQMYEGPSTTYGLSPALDVVFAGIWLLGNIEHAGSEEEISYQHLTSAANVLRLHYRRVFGDHHYIKALNGQRTSPVLHGATFHGPEFGGVTAKVGNLGEITVHADGRQSYDGPLEPINNPMKPRRGRWLHQ